MNKGVITYLDLGRMGRLGNQLFELAAVLAIAKENKFQAILPMHVKNLPIFQLFNIADISFSSSLKIDKELYECIPGEIPKLEHGKVYNINGYRQSLEYIEKLGNVRDLFKFKKEQIELEQIAIHIRRTDTIKTGKWSNIFDPPLNLPFSYFREAIKKLRTTHKLPYNYPVVVVTDDRDWASKHLFELDPFASLSNTGTLEDDLATLINSSYLVISNSTFSIWAAYLKRSGGNKIVAPIHWFHPDNIIVKLIGSDTQKLYREDWLLSLVQVERRFSSDFFTSILRGIVLSNSLRHSTIH